MSLAALVAAPKLPSETLAWLASADQGLPSGGSSEIPGLQNGEALMPFAAAFANMFGGVAASTAAHDLGHFAAGARCSQVLHSVDLFVECNVSVQVRIGTVRAQRQLWHLGLSHSDSQACASPRGSALPSFILNSHMLNASCRLCTQAQAWAHSLRAQRQPRHLWLSDRPAQARAHPIRYVGLCSGRACGRAGGERGAVLDWAWGAYQ